MNDKECASSNFIILCKNETAQNYTKGSIEQRNYNNSKISSTFWNPNNTVPTPRSDKRINNGFKTVEIEQIRIFDIDCTGEKINKDSYAGVSMV
jgi:hypothetical protein